VVTEVVESTCLNRTTPLAPVGFIVVTAKKAPDPKQAKRVSGQKSATFDPITASQQQMPPRAWRPGLEPAELSFRVPHFFHQIRRGSSGPRISIMVTFLATRK
jgi:hypothetical protein